MSLRFGFGPAVCLSNIVNRANLYDAGSFEQSKDAIARLLHNLFSPAEHSSQLLAGKVLENQDGVLRLLELEPVYGATIVILAAGFSLQTIGLTSAEDRKTTDRS